MPATSSTAAAVAVDISVSVVSHGQGAMIAHLLAELADTDWHDGRSFEVIVTINIPENESWLPRNAPYRLVVLRNDSAKGFGANHNAAFEVAQGRFFAVVNPDIRIPDFHVEHLVAALGQPDAGVCGPLVLTPGGNVEDSARVFPTAARLIRRRFARTNAPDYRPGQETIAVDWLAGMLLLFPATIFRAIGGFDERYFMYLEDVEISRTLRARGLRSLWVGTTSVVHDASRASKRSLRHLRYHLASALRYFLSPSRG